MAEEISADEALEAAIRILGEQQIIERVQIERERQRQKADLSVVPTNADTGEAEEA